eukprot:SAG22_NODE_3165_length_1887_cov_1.673378_3_plen_205_part_00
MRFLSGTQWQPWTPAPLPVSRLLTGARLGLTSWGTQAAASRRRACFAPPVAAVLPLPYSPTPPRLSAVASTAVLAVLLTAHCCLSLRFFWPLLSFLAVLPTAHCCLSSVVSSMLSSVLSSVGPHQHNRLNLIQAAGRPLQLAFRRPADVGGAGVGGGGGGGGEGRADTVGQPGGAAGGGGAAASPYWQTAEGKVRELAQYTVLW